MSAAAVSVYFDYNATTPLAPECLEAMRACLELGPINPSSKHHKGEQAKRLVMEARAAVAALLGATPAEIVLTGSATEANHQAILGALALDPAKRHIVTSEVEHPSVLLLLRHLESTGVRVSYLPVDGEGRLNLDALRDVIAADTALVTLMWANNETGVLFPIDTAAEIARARGVPFHTDAVQAVGKLPVDLKRVPADMLTLAGHKLHAPSGIGALFVRKGRKFAPLLFGHQERGRRGGTENVAGAVGLGAACKLAAARLGEDSPRLAALRDRLEAGVLARFPYARVNGGGAPRIANTTNLRFGDLDADSILTRLDRAGFCAAAGAACSSSGNKPSHVLMAMGIGAAAAFASIRFSLGRDNTAQEVDALLDTLSALLADDLAVRTA